jgi:hypothetical protein
MKTKEQSKDAVKAKIAETDAEIDRITGIAVHRREEKAAELINLPLEKRMQILTEIPLFTAEEHDCLKKLQIKRSGLSDILERFFAQAFQSLPDEDEPLY